MVACDHFSKMSILILFSFYLYRAFNHRHCQKSSFRKEFGCRSLVSDPDATVAKKNSLNQHKEDILRENRQTHPLLGDTRSDSAIRKSTTGGSSGG